MRKKMLEKLRKLRKAAPTSEILTENTISDFKTLDLGS